MEKIKKHWKEILIVFLTVLLISNCTGKGNYKRKYDKQIQRTECVMDSLNNAINAYLQNIDSLNGEIKILNKEIISLNNNISIYKEQNAKLANKPVIVRINNNTEEKK